MVKGSAALFAALVFAASARAEHARPSLIAARGAVSISLPAAILREAAVRKQLGSGLTTIFEVSAKQEGRRVGLVRIEARFDLWDEVWLVRRVEFDSREERQRLPSMEALQRWWESPSRFMSSGSRAPVEVEVLVLPFSAAEEKDARDWITKGGGVARPGGGGGLVDTLIGTTISARPIITFRWKGLAVPR